MFCGTRENQDTNHKKWGIRLPGVAVRTIGVTLVGSDATLPGDIIEHNVGRPDSRIELRVLAQSMVMPLL